MSAAKPVTVPMASGAEDGGRQISLDEAGQEPGEHELCTGPQHTAERAGQEPEPQEAQGIDPQDEALGRAEGAQDRAVVQVPGREAARSHDDRDAGEAEARERRQPQALLTALEGVTRSGLAGCS